MSRVSRYIFLAAALLLAVSTFTAGDAQAGNSSPWVGIKNVKNMDVWRKGEGVSVSLDISPPGGAEGQLDIKLYAMDDSGAETHALDMLSAHPLGSATQYTLEYTLPASLQSGMYMLRCRYSSGIDAAPDVTANAVVVVLEAGQPYGWQGYAYYDIAGPLQDGIYSILDTSNNTIDYYCFENGQAVSTLRSDGDCTYMFDKDQGLLTGWQKPDGWMYFSEDAASYGEMATGWLQDKGAWYLMDDEGNMQTGWQKVGNTWYHLESNGAMQTGWLKDGADWYYLKTNGALQVGWQRIGGGNYGPLRWYYFKSTGIMHTGWLKDGGKWYYMQASGAMATGWQSINGKWYYFDTSTGAMQTGWVKIGGQSISRWYYLDPVTGAMHSNTTIEGYTLGQDGAMI